MMYLVHASIAGLLLFGAVPAVTESLDQNWTAVELESDWIPLQDGWALEDGMMTHPDPFFHGGVLALPALRFEDLAFEADVMIPDVYWDTESVWAGLLTRSPGPLDGGIWHGGYMFFIRADGRVSLVVPGGTDLAETETNLRPREEPIRLRIELEGEQIRCYADDTLVLEASDDRHAVGEVALTHFGNVAGFANVRLSGMALEPEPIEMVEPEHPTPKDHDPVDPLPAIGVRRSPEGQAEFYVRETAERFVPLGFNHTVLEERHSGWHYTFNVGLYDPDEMEGVLSEMADVGTNTIRVWIWGTQDEAGFTGGQDSRGLNGAYMENVVDFFQRATRHGIYVMPVMDETPHNAYYSAIAANAEREADADPAITGYNRNYLSPGPLAAKRMAVADFVRYIKETDPGLLRTVLGWSFANEVFVNHNQGPYLLSEGTVRTSTGQTYDMADKHERQASYDDAIKHFSNVLTEAVKSVDPDALTTIGMWTADAHGREPYNGLLPDDRDPRRPPRPAVLASDDCLLDFLDIHIYPWDGTSKVRPDAHEWDAVGPSAKPAIVGEYGVFKRNTIDEARVMLREMLEQAYDMGYQGSLHWVWDMTMVEGQTWSSVEEGLAEYIMDLDIHPE